ncbi:hypothetical protein D9V41_15900 [Aeromicrobium phragmitis]|uniref:Uncharacterized protein n=1 Tax=Aeromicrobium phragmitis TaxID=2478914 RepID=A0A3L8PH39_9ACTN|nr:hypothetical protein [Aeromicrobium phragmitis]RLV54526.1 hypothetical protein D9V41_15900 [Aeromicrobium phragmitis]
MDHAQCHAELHFGLSTNLIVHGECVVSFHTVEREMDVAQPLDWPGKSLAFEVAPSVDTSAGRKVAVDVGTLKRHVDAPVPVYYIINVEDWRSGSMSPLGRARYPWVYFGDVIGVCSARDVHGQVSEPGTEGLSLVDVEKLPLWGWHEFIVSLSTDAPSAGPPTRIAAVRAIDERLFDDPNIAARLADHGKSNPRVREQIQDDGREVFTPLACDLTRKPPKIPLHNYLPTGSGYRTAETEELKEEFRRYAQTVECGRVGPKTRDGLMVVTMSWKKQHVLARLRAQRGRDR